MCAVGDIIVIEKYMDRGHILNRHSFVVIDDTPDQIEGISYDIICNVMSSFKDAEQRRRKLQYPGNLPVETTDVDIQTGNTRTGYIKADQMYYFKKEKMQYRVIGKLTEEFLEELIAFIEDGDFELVDIIDNL